MVFAVRVEVLRSATSASKRRTYPYPPVRCRTYPLASPITFLRDLSNINRTILISITDISRPERLEPALFPFSCHCRILLTHTLNPLFYSSRWINKAEGSTGGLGTPSQISQPCSEGIAPMLWPRRHRDQIC